jgi:Phage integrase family
MLRHACGYKLANDGVETRSLQAYMGHKNIQHTVRYTDGKTEAECRVGRGGEDVCFPPMAERSFAYPSRAGDDRIRLRAGTCVSR